MNAEHQSWIAAAIVLVTSAAFVIRALRRKKTGCAGCGCQAPRAKTPK